MGQMSEVFMVYEILISQYFLYPNNQIKADGEFYVQIYKSLTARNRIFPIIRIEQVMNLETVYLFSIKTIKHFVAGKQMGTKNVQCCFFQQTSDVTRDAL